MPSNFGDTVEQSHFCRNACPSGPWVCYAAYQAEP